MKIETMLHDEIQSELEALRGMELGDDSHKAAVDDITRLMDRAIEIDKLNAEVDVKQKQMADEKKNRVANNIITGAGVTVQALGLGVTVWGIIKALKFEETGTVTTIIGRGLINKLLPKK